MMTNLMLPCVVTIITLLFPVSSAPYDYDDDYEDYGYGSYSSHKDRGYSTYSPPPTTNYDPYRNRYYETTPSPYRYRPTPPPYKYNYGNYDYPDYKDKDISSSFQPAVEKINILGFLPRSVTDWLDNTLIKVGDIVSEIAQSKEKAVVDFVDETLRKGEEVATNLWEDVMNKTEDKQRDIMGTISDFERKLFAIPNSVQKIWERDEPLTSAESVENKEALADIKNKLNAFEKKVEEEIENEKDLPFALRNQLLKFVTASRDLVKEVGGEEETFWNKIKLMEKEMYQFQLTTAEASDVLKDKLDSLFNALKKVDLPKLKSVKKGEKKLNEVDTFLNKLLTE